ncbi:manganese transporter [Fulvivirga imtechensis AK7]|uniref:Manganese transporter n=2 Tax=Fulvivirga TaxID=396811 RepID=L8JU02_9BACT|nr:manganese transporter [Fulvivirga imtechensis AK7]
MFKFELIWALAFATVACIALQEMAARITIASGMEIGNTIKMTTGFSWLAYFIGFGVIFGCAAYEAGNILGALAGVQLLLEADRIILTIIIGIACALLLWLGTVKTIVNLLGVMVAVMGIAFCYVAWQAELSLSEIGQGMSFSIPEGSEWLILGLVGTTIVPYNLFLGSGISHGQSIKNMRFGLVVSVVLGGIVSIAILITGTKIDGTISFQNLAIAMGDSLGNSAKVMLALGLFAAGFTSSITAPLAAGVLAKSIAGTKKEHIYKRIWQAVLMAGLIFGISEVKPIPVIIAAQALNGMILPMVAILLIIQANNARLIGSQYMNSKWFNVLSLIILNIVLLIGLNNIFKAATNALGLAATDETVRLIYLQILALPLMVFTIYKIWQLRKN